MYNAAPYVEQAVLSMLGQSLRDFECIIIDDGSTDGSGEILQKLAARDGRIRLIQRENRGIISSLNEGLSLARAPFIARMDADDIALPTRLEEQRRYLDQHPEITVLGSAIQFMDSQGKGGRIKRFPAHRAIDDRVFKEGTPVAHPAVMLRTDALRRVGGYPVDFPFAEDYALWLRLWQAGGRFHNLPQALLRYRTHGASVSYTHALRQRSSVLRAQALWLAGATALPPGAADMDNEQLLSALALPTAEKQLLLARMIIRAFRMTAAGDPESLRWMALLTSMPARGEWRRLHMLLHLHTALAAHSPVTAFRELARAFRLDWLTTTKACCRFAWRCVYFSWLLPRYLYYRERVTARVARLCASITHRVHNRS